MKAKIKLTVLSMLAALTTFGAPASRGKPTMAENEHQLPELYGVLFEKTNSRNDKAVGVCRVPLNGNDEPEVLINGMDKCVGDGLRYSGVYLDGTYYFTYCLEGGWIDTGTRFHVWAKEAGMYTCDMQSLQLIHTDYRKRSEEEVDPSKCYSAMAYDYATNYVYASGFGQDLEDNIFQKIKFVDGKPERVSVILKGPGAGKDYLASAGIGRMYEPGYTSSFEDICLYTVDIVNGDEKYIGKVGIEGGRYIAKTKRAQF